jgi:hypothetical protein
MVLQTIALPLGDRATGLKSCQLKKKHFKVHRKE